MLKIVQQNCTAKLGPGTRKTYAPMMSGVFQTTNIYTYVTWHCWVVVRLVELIPSFDSGRAAKRMHMRNLLPEAAGLDAGAFPICGLVL